MKHRATLQLALTGTALCSFVVACNPEPIEPTGGVGGSGGSGGSGAAGGTAGAAGAGLSGGGAGGAPAGAGGATAGGSGAGGAPPAAGGSAGSVTGGSAGAGAGGASGAGAGGTGGAGGDAPRAGGGGAPEAGAGGNAAGKGGASGAGSSGAGGSGGGAGGEAMKSEGCGMSTTQMLGRWVESTPSGSSRPYSVYLPTGYDPMRAYPVVVLLHGCGGGMNNLPMELQTGSDAILIRGTGSAADTCWTTTANGADIAFFDAMVADVKARFCTDTSRFFVVGYSSGSWLANQLGCIRTSTLRALATVAGGNPGVRNCGGPIAHIFFHDEGDNSNNISGSESARDRLLTENGCDASAAPVAEDPSPCVRYQGCDPGYPVVWCATTGEGHNRQDSVAAPAFWNFFKEF
jgi:polyhydroxybutyrate depolymerase